MKTKLVLKRADYKKVSEMADGDFAVVVDGGFRGEVIFRNVAGIHGLTENRFWPSEFIARDSKNVHPYQPEFNVQVLQAGDTLTIENE